MAMVLTGLDNVQASAQNQKACERYLQLAWTPQAFGSYQDQLSGSPPAGPVPCSWDDSNSELQIRLLV